MAKCNETSGWTAIPKADSEYAREFNRSAVPLVIIPPRMNHGRHTFLLGTGWVTALGKSCYIPFRSRTAFCR